MGSTEEGSRGRDQWWESPALVPVDLRQHSDAWNLAGDAATASLLQSISQRLVSRTHEVEGMLQKVLEETDRVSAAILNTSNSFHMLANTQFIENRTYQDDADVAKSKTPEIQNKLAVTEDDVIARCKAAISAGINLVNKSYERHEIQDSESDDEDGNDSPLPIYALIDPYENKPLPYIIGSQLFMQDNRIGLLEPSSEENSKATLTPEETDSEEESDLDSKKNKPIPASSSKIIEDESDSDLSDESLERPRTNPLPNNVHHHLPSSSEEEDDEDNLFRPPAKATPKITNNGPSLSNELNKKFGNTTTAATTPSNKRDIGFDSESDEDGDLFGRKPESSGGLFGNPPAIPAAKREEKSHSSEHKSKSVSGKSKTGVENVRAMPDPTKIQVPATIKRPTPVKSDLFASDSDDDDDDGDLFSSRSRSASRISNSSSKVTAKIPVPAPSAQAPVPKPSSRGLFSSDGDEEDEGGLFGSRPAAPPGSTATEEKPSEESPALAKPSGRKVPVGGVSIFGSAITTALRRQQTPDLDQSDEDSDWGGSQKSSASAKKHGASESFSSVVGVQEPLSLQKPVEQVVVAGKSSGGGGLFDDDDEDDLFGVVPKKVGSVTSKTKVENSKLFAPVLSGSSEKSILKKEQSENGATDSKHPSQPVKKTTVGLFSDDDDDLFGVAVSGEKRPSILPVSQPSSESADTKKQLVNVKDISITKATSDETNRKKATTTAVKVPGGTKSQPSALFSSPSDDDLFAPPKVPQTTRSVPVMIAEPPPPLPVTSTVKSTSDLFGSPSSDDDLFATPVSNSSKPVINSPASIPSNLDKSSEKIIAEKPQESRIVENVKEKPPPLLSNNIFSSPSDDDDLFSIPSSVVTKKVEEKSEPPRPTKSSSSEVKDEKSVSDNVNSISSKANNVILESSSPDEDLFAPKKIDGEVHVKDTNSVAPSKSKITPSKSVSKSKSDLFMSPEDEENDIFSGLAPKISNKISEAPSAVIQSNKNKKVNLFDSPDSDEDIFAAVPGDVSKGKDSGPVSDKPKLTLSESTSDEDIFSSPKLQPYKQEDTVPIPVKKSVIPPCVDDRESPPALPPDPTDSQGSDSLIETTSAAEVVQPQKPPYKPPVGGVALFGGSELAAKINKRKSALDDVKEASEAVREEKEPTNTNQQTIATKENDSKKDIFAINDTEDDDIFGSSYVPPQSSVSLVNQTSPPPLPSEAEDKSVKPVHKSDLAASKDAPVKQTLDDLFLPGDSESKNLKKRDVKEIEPTIIVNNEAKEEKSKKADVKEEEERTDAKVATDAKVEEKPKKRPPIGGISMFGGGGLGGSELFAKVQQRKSMLAPDSDEDENDNVIPSANSKAEEKDLTGSKSSRSSSSETISPVSPMSPISPVIPSSPSSKTTSLESGVSFEEPITSSTILQNANKTRARGNKQRRPPSRAHRRGESSVSTVSVVTTTPTPAVVVPNNVNTFQSSEKKNEIISSSTSLTNCKDNLPESVIRISSVVQEKTVGSDSVKKTENIRDSPSDSVKDTGDFGGDADDDDLFGKPRSASSVSKSSSIRKKLGPSLFGENDSDDDDLFGVPKSKNSSGAQVKTSQNSMKSNTIKPAPAQALFGDDDEDDIFASSRKGKKPSSSVQKKASAVKPKSNLKPSSEPFEDPLLGNRK